MSSPAKENPNAVVNCELRSLVSNGEEPITKKDLVRALAYQGKSGRQIAELLGMSQETFRRHYQPLVADAKDAMDAEVLATAYRMATSGQHERVTMYWLKAMMGFREGALIDNRRQIVNVNLPLLSKEQWLDRFGRQDDTPDPVLPAA